MREALMHCGGTNLSPAHGTTALVMACELGAEEDVRALVEANGANIELAAMPGLTRVTMKASNVHRPHHPVPAFYTGTPRDPAQSSVYVPPPQSAPIHPRTD